ncbi:NAD-dependent epimerase/dehydratase family protein [Planosporangium mesophilum]|uniref:NAD-dependent epimerase n=1 Tax=Planosporangium mesophilum TaxID=689768 RepID=A0A8J3THL5_9ACTN|nr:NAD-dependent epimerase/dehydratase family protein [Planosporangium mesophilum]NJC86246.1 NAD-dependent epimerase/dehydratase family protein [Planosporangium mesophilum]GII25771.1 NAD-dependent epimerase [Planosporangium mesophilum]
MRLAVTGASGFCGAAVARAAVAAGFEVVCLGRRSGPVGRHVPWDAAADTPDLAGADAVVHLAAAVGDPPPGAAVEAAFRRVNVDGTARLTAAAAGRPVVYVSSASVYAPGRYEQPLTEEHPIGGQRTAYGRTKADGEALALAAGAVALRPRAVYGPGDPHLLPRLRRAVRAGVALLPGPDAMLSLTAVENLADACLAALDWPPGAYNITDATAYRRDDAVRRVLDALGTPARLVHVPPGLAYAAASAARLAGRLSSTSPTLTRYAVDQLANGVVLDTTRATAQGWRPRYDLDRFTAWLCGGGRRR